MVALLMASPISATLRTEGSSIRAIWWMLDDSLHGRKTRLAGSRWAYSEIALRRATLLLGAFALARGVKRATVCCSDGLVQSISFYPPSFELEWATEHAIFTGALGDAREPIAGYLKVTVEDMLHLAARVVAAVIGSDIGSLPECCTASLVFAAVPSNYPGFRVQPAVRVTIAHEGEDQAVFTV